MPQSGSPPSTASRHSPNLVAAAVQPETHDLYRAMVDLECRSTFGLRQDMAAWLNDGVAGIGAQRLAHGVAACTGAGSAAHSECGLTPCCKTAALSQWQRPTASFASEPQDSRVAKRSSCRGSAPPVRT